MSEKVEREELREDEEEDDPVDMFVSESLDDDESSEEEEFFRVLLFPDEMTRDDVPAMIRSRPLVHLDGVSRKPHLGQIDFSSGRLDRTRIHRQ